MQPVGAALVAARGVIVMASHDLSVRRFSSDDKAVKLKSSIFADITDTIDNSPNVRLWEDSAAHGFRFSPSWLDFDWTDKAFLQRQLDSRQSGDVQPEQINSNSPSLYATFPGGSYSTLEGYSQGDPVAGAVFFSPPDNGLAIAPNGYIVSVVNDAIGWTADFTKTMEFKAFSQFFPPSSVGNVTFDPQVLYDYDHDKFIVTEELYRGYSTKSNTLIAVSDGSDPTGKWNFFSIDSRYSFGNNKTFADYPQIATDGVNLYITSDQFDSTKYYGSVVTVVNLSSIESKHPGPIDITRFPAETPIAETLDVAANPGKGAFFVGYSGYSQNGPGGNVSVVTIDYYDESTKQTAFSTVEVGKIDNLEVTRLVAIEPTNGDLLDASDRRINDVKVIGNHLFAITEVVPNPTETVPNPLPNVHWFDFDISDPTDPFLEAQGDVPGSVFGEGAAVTTFNGSIAGDSPENLVLNFTATGLLGDGSPLFPGDFFAVHRSTDGTDPANFWEKPIQYASSPTSYSDGIEISRWGDYSSAIFDPTHSQFLISNEYAVDSSHWGTSIAAVSLDATGTGAPTQIATAPESTSLAVLNQYVAAFQSASGAETGANAIMATPETMFGQTPFLTKPAA